MTDNSALGLKVKGRNKGGTKSPPPCRHDLMLCAIHRCQNHQGNDDTSQPFLSYNEHDLCNDYISKDPANNDHFCINFSCHCVLRHVLLDTDPLDNVDP